MSQEKTLQVLLAVDGSAHSAAAVALTAGMPWPVGASATVLAVVPERWSFGDLSPEARQVVDDTLAKVRQVERAAAERLAAQAAEELRARGLSAQAEAREGRPSEVILGRASDLPASLIAIGARGLSAPDEFLLGSTAHKVSHYAECPVLVVRPPERAQPTSVILAADGSPEAERAAEFLCALSLPGWAEVTVVSVAEMTVGVPAGARQPVTDAPEAVRQALLDAAEARTAEIMRRLGACGAQVRSAIRPGHPAGEILAAAREHDADLVVVGARGQTRAAPFPLGGVAQKVVKYAPCSVLVVR